MIPLPGVHQEWVRVVADFYFLKKQQVFASLPNLPFTLPTLTVSEMQIKSEPTTDEDQEFTFLKVEIQPEDCDAESDTNSMQVAADPISMAAAKEWAAKLECLNKSHYKCDRCRSSRFASRAWLEKHVNDEHWPLKVKFSSECNYASTYEGRIQKHIKLFHGWL